MQTLKDETRRVPLGAIKKHPELQPRSLEMLKVRDRPRQEQQSETHIRDMALLLRTAPKEDLSPIDLADVDGILYIVDGHHRCAAYKRAKREGIPAHVKVMTLRQAHTASKFANVQGTKLEMQPEQKRNALWHFLAAETLRGTTPLKPPHTQRTLAGQFGVQRSTLQTMLQKLPEVDPTKFDPAHLDSITGWPHWKWAKSTVRNQMWQVMTPEMRLEWQAEKYEKALRKLWDRYTPEVVAQAHRKMVAEGAGGDGEPEDMATAIRDVDMAHAMGYGNTSPDF